MTIKQLKLKIIQLRIDLDLNLVVERSEMEEAINNFRREVEFVPIEAVNRSPSTSEEIDAIHFTPSSPAPPQRRMDSPCLRH